MQSHEVKDYHTYAKLGQFQEAAKCLQTALEDKPNDLETFYMLHRLGEKVLDSTLKNKIAEVISDNNCTKMNLAYGNLLLAKFEQLDANYEGELNYLLEGHGYFFQSKITKFNEELKYWFNILPRIEEIVSLKKTNANNHHMKPIFIVGLPRCGSTLIEKILTSGPKQIPIGEETGIFNTLIHQGSREKILEAYRQRDLMRATSDYTFTDKSLENFFYIKFIKEIFPNAKIVNCTRNTLSSVMSILQTNLTEVAWAHHLKHIYKFFNIYHQKMKNFPNFIYHLNYEKFINNPEVESKKLMEYCNLPWSKECLEVYKRKDIVSNTASNVQIRKAIHKHSLNKYLAYEPFILKHRKGENSAIIREF
jgi:tetratricopeptide (TPR) repeat protein